MINSILPESTLKTVDIVQVDVIWIVAVRAHDADIAEFV